MGGGKGVGGALTTAGAAYHDFIRGFHPIPFPRVQPETYFLSLLGAALRLYPRVHESKPWTLQVTMGKVWSADITL